MTPAPAKAPEPEPVEEVAAMQVGVAVDDEDTGWETDEEDEGEDGIPTTDCLFCSHSSADFQENLSHMSIKHGFFIPDVEYCTDVEGLLTYLGKYLFSYLSLSSNLLVFLEGRKLEWDSFAYGAMSEAGRFKLWTPYRSICATKVTARCCTKEKPCWNIPTSMTTGKTSCSVFTISSQFVISF